MKRFTVAAAAAITIAIVSPALADDKRNPQKSECIDNKMSDIIGDAMSSHEVAKLIKANIQSLVRSVVACDSQFGSDATAMAFATTLLPGMLEGQADKMLSNDEISFEKPLRDMSAEDRKAMMANGDEPTSQDETVRLVEQQRRCLSEGIQLEYNGQTGSFKDWMEIKVTNNTNIPTAWIAIEVVQRDARYSNILKKDTGNTVFEKTIGPGETIIEQFYGAVPEGRIVEVKTINMRDLEGKRLIDDNTNYIGSDFPEEISSVICQSNR